MLPSAFEGLSNQRLLTAFPAKTSVNRRLLAAIQIANGTVAAAHGEGFELFETCVVKTVTRLQTLLLEEARPGGLRRLAALLLPPHAVAAVPLNPLNYTGSRRTDILQEQRPA
jgi:hypothetical protein